MAEKPIRSDWVIIMGQSFHKVELLKLCIIFLLGLLLVIGIASFLLYDYLIITEEEAELVEVHEVSKQGPEVEQHPVEYFIEQHFLKTRYNEVNSIRALGTYTAGEVVMDFELLAKQPRYYKQVLKANGRTVEAGFDGHTLWFQQDYPILDEEDKTLLELNKALAMLECAIPCLAWEYENGVTERGSEILSAFEILPETIWNERPCIVVKNTQLLHYPVYHYIDKETGMELYRRALVVVGERRQKEVELFYAEPLEGLKYPIPAGFELFVDGHLFCTAAFDRVEINRGLMSYLFKKPAGDD